MPWSGGAEIFERAKVGDVGWHLGLGQSTIFFQLFDLIYHVLLLLENFWRYFRTFWGLLFFDGFWNGLTKSLASLVLYVFFLAGGNVC